MAIIMMDAGAEYILDTYFTSEQHTLCLFTDTNAANSDQLGTCANYTIIPADDNGSGYANHTLYANEAMVGIAANANDGPVGIAFCYWSNAAPYDFVFAGPLTGNATVKGYLVHANNAGNASEKKVIFAEWFPTPIQPQNPDDTISVEPVFRLGNITDVGTISG